MWEEVLGVDTRLRTEEWKVFVQTRRAGVITEVFRGGWFADYADPLNFLEPFTSGNPLNAVGYADAGFDALVATAASSTGPDRDHALRAAEQRLLGAHALIPLFHYSSKHLVSPEVCGYRAHPLDHHPSELLRWCEAPP
jgi:oligopeptide transport system substrate-binding protein